MTRFFEFLADQQEEIPSDLEDLEEFMCIHMEELWLEGHPKAWAADVLSAITFYIRGARGHLAAAWKLLSVWQRLELPCRCAPLSLLQIHCMIGFLLSMKDLNSAAAIQVGFECVLRSGEIFALTAGDCRFNASLTLCQLDLGLTKSGKRSGRRETVTTKDPTTLLLLGLVLLDKPAGTRLLPRGGPTFRKVFDQTLRTMGYFNKEYLPYALRRGGATHEFLASGKLDKTALRGRWSSTKTARIYINEGAALLAEIQATPLQMRQQELGIKHFGDFDLLGA